MTDTLSDEELIRWLEAEIRLWPGAICERRFVAVRDRLSTLLRERERHEQALEEILRWSEAYPLKVFPEPDLEKAAAVLSAAGMTLDAISASAMRHVLTGVRDIARAALAHAEPHQGYHFWPDHDAEPQQDDG